MRRSILIVAFLAALMVTGCGGGSDGDSGSTASNAAEEVEYPKGPTREFFIPGGDNVVQLYGKEATKSEREEASQVIESWMSARSAGNWGDYCRFITADTAQYAVNSAKLMSEGEVMKCPKASAFVFANTDRSQANNMSGPIDSLRVGETHSYAQYHGNDGRDWIVVVEREGGGWKVSGLDPLDRLK